MNRFGYTQEYLPIFHLVACTRGKLDRKEPVPAKDLYCSRWFRLVRKVIEQRGEPWATLSANYRLLSPESMVFAYDETLNTKTPEQRAAWADSVIESLPRADRYVIWGGENYFEFLAEPLGAELPLQGKGIGQQLGYLGALSDDRPPLIDAARAALDMINRMEPETPDDQGASDFDWDTVKIQLAKAIKASEIAA